MLFRSNLICASGCGGGGTATSTTGASSPTSAYFATKYLDGSVYKSRLFYVTIPGFTYSTINGSMNEIVVGLAVRPSDGVVFVAYYERQLVDPFDYVLKFGTVSTSDGTITNIGTINSGGTDFTDLSANDRYSLEFASDGTLYLSYWISEASHDSQIYTLNTTTGAVTQLGTGVMMDSALSIFYLMSMAFDSSGTAYGLGWWSTGATYDYAICSINLTPNPSYSNRLLATVQCTIMSGALPAPTVDNTIWQGLVCKDGNKYIWVRGTGDIYQQVLGASCSSALKMTGTSAMGGITAVAGIPS